MWLTGVVLSAAASSALLCLWVRSYWYTDSVVRNRTIAQTADGRIMSAWSWRVVHGQERSGVTWRGVHDVQHSGVTWRDVHDLQSSGVGEILGEQSGFLSSGGGIGVYCFSRVYHSNWTKDAWGYLEWVAAEPGRQNVTEWKTAPGFGYPVLGKSLVRHICYYENETSGGGDWHSLVIVFPYPTLLLPISFPALWGLFSAMRRHWRGTAGHCSKCGYDLRATPDRCPECGAFTASSAPVTNSPDLLESS
jgi:hypothetical protein